MITGDVRNGAIVYWDAHRKRIVDAIGSNVIKYDLQPGMLLPIGGTGGPAGWTETVTEAGDGTTEFTGVAEAGAVGVITTAANENDGGNWQLNTACFELTADQIVYVGSEFKISDATQSDYFMGLAITDTDILGGVDDSIGFRKVDATTAVSFLSENGGTETAQAGVLTQTTGYHFLEFYWDGSTVEAFVDGSSVYHALPANIPNDVNLRLSLNFLAGSAGVKTMTFRQLRAIQIGR